MYILNHHSCLTWLQGILLWFGSCKFKVCHWKLEFATHEWQQILQVLLCTNVGVAINIKGFKLPSCFMWVHDLNQSFLQIRNKTNEKISSLWRVLSELNQKVGWRDSSFRLKRIVCGFWSLNPSRVWSLACCHQIQELKIETTIYIRTHTTYVTLKWIIHNTFWCLLSLGWKRPQLSIVSVGIWYLILISWVFFNF
jgi:hypothetical protein